LATGHIFHPAEGAGGGMLFGHGPVFRDFNFEMDMTAATRIVALGLGRRGLEAFHTVPAAERSARRPARGAPGEAAGARFGALLRGRLDRHEGVAG
jgi:hypothetical protein